MMFSSHMILTSTLREMREIRIFKIMSTKKQTNKEQMKTMSAGDMYFLPEECWECVFKFLNNNNHDHHHLESLSLVSKQFLSITNRIRFSLAVHDDLLPFLPRLLHRFPNLTSLDLTRFRGDLDALLLQISRFPLRRLTSLDFSHHETFPANGLRALAENTKTLTSLTSSEGSLATADLHLITDCFPFLQELDIRIKVHDHFPLALPKLLRKVTLYCGPFNINDAELISVCNNCEFLQELAIPDCASITQHGIASAIRQRPGLRSFFVGKFKFERGDFESPFITASFIDSLVSLKSLTCLVFRDSFISDELLCSVAEEGLPLRKLVLDYCRNYTYAGISCLLSRCKFVQHLALRSAEFLNDQLVADLSVFLGNLISIDLSCCQRFTELTLFALIRNCSLLREIEMEISGIGQKNNYLMNCCVNPHVKFLHLAWSSCMRGEILKKLSFVCPNLELLDLRFCFQSKLSEGVVEVLRRCSKIRHLSLGHGSTVKLHGVNFEVPNVEVLSFAHSGIGDGTLSVVSKSFCRLKYLDLESCPNVTAKGVRKVVENCKQLREIKLKNCKHVAGDVVDWMVFSRPTLRKIMAPPDFKRSASQDELFLRHGCRVCR
ncbi:F-box protein At1g47056-like [Lotus japonicus]|uniref:F-box protein At1g47056-like n=1 Tax=Lotus japonicus TaxID=34305 RepID=UPI002584D01D|nr:F-box protein At1g47056-like [Lotus japonicus]